MINEKMKVLKMLEEGRISADDAAKLLEAAGTGAAVSTPSPVSDLSYPPTAGFSSTADNGERREVGRGTASTARPVSPASPSSSSITAADLTRKLERMFDKMEPKLQRLAEVVVEKTGSAASAIQKNIAQAQAARAAKPVEPPPPKPQTTGAVVPTHSKRIERNIELTVSEQNSELILDALNGQIHIKGYNGDKITAKILYTPKRGNPVADLIALGNKYYLSYDENEFESVSVDAYIPETMFSSIRAANTNGHMVISTVTADDIRFENQNGDIEITGLAAKNLIIETNNGNMRLNNITADRASIDDFNGSIQAANIDAAQMKMTTFNGGVSMQVAGFNRYREYTWGIESNNGKATLILPSSVDIGYNIRATAALSEVRMGLTGLSYTKNLRDSVEAESTNFDIAPRRVELMMETSNAPIVLN